MLISAPLGMNYKAEHAVLNWSAFVSILSHKCVWKMITTPFVVQIVYSFYSHVPTQDQRLQMKGGHMANWHVKIQCLLMCSTLVNYTNR